MKWIAAGAIRRPAAPYPPRRGSRHDRDRGAARRRTITQCASGAIELLSPLRGGDLGQLPVIAGLVVIWTVFQVLNPVFLSPRNLVDLTMQCAAIGTISLGIVLVLLLGEIDLSVGSVSGLSAAVLAVGLVELQWNLVLALLAAIAVGCLVGMLYGFLYTRFGVPSFIITLAGLLGFLGLQLWVLGDTGSISLPVDSWIVQFAQQMYLPPWASYLVVALAVGVYAWTLTRRARCVPPRASSVRATGRSRCAAARFSPSCWSPPGT